MQVKASLFRLICCRTPWFVNLQVLSESAQRLSEELKSRYSTVEWRKIADFRNRLVHDYLGVDLEIVWQVIEKDLPALKRAIVEMLSSDVQRPS